MDAFPKRELIIGYRPDHFPGKVVFRDGAKESVFDEPRSLSYRIEPRGIPGDPLYKVSSWYVVTVVDSQGHAWTLHPDVLTYTTI